MMRSIFFAVMLLGVLSLAAISQYGLLYLSIEPSSINRALGGDVVGCVNVWHPNPLTFYANPAIGAFHDGLAWGSTHDKWGDNWGLESPQYYDASILSFGYRGLSLLSSVSNQNDYQGISFDSGLQTFLNEAAVEIGEAHLIDRASFYGIAVNPMRLFSGKRRIRRWITDYIDVAAGANFLSTEADYFDVQTETVKTARAKTINAGGIARWDYTLMNTLGIDLVYGVSHFNINKDKITYGKPQFTDTIWLHRSQGYGASVTVKAGPFISQYLSKDKIFFENIVSIRYLNAELDPLTRESEIIKAKGTEIGFLDTFFIRNGDYQDKAGHITGKTSGYGIKLGYKKMISFSYNYAEMPGGELGSPQVSEDYGVTLDLVKIVDRIISN